MQTSSSLQGAAPWPGTPAPGDRSIMAADLRSQTAPAAMKAAAGASLDAEERAGAEEHKWAPDGTLERADELQLIGLGWKMRRDFKEAEKAFSECVKIRETVLGPDAPPVALALNQLGWVLKTQKRWIEAEQTYRRSLAVREKNVPPEHRSLVVALKNLAEVLKERSKQAEADALVARAAAITRPGKIAEAAYAAAKAVYDAEDARAAAAAASSAAAALAGADAPAPAPIADAPAPAEPGPAPVAAAPAPADAGGE